MSDSDMTNSCSSCGSSSSCGGSDCSTCGGCSTDANQHSTITLTMEDDTEVECAILTIFPVDAKEYIALLPLDEEGQNHDGEVYLYSFTRTAEGAPMLSNIDNNLEAPASPGSPDIWSPEGRKCLHPTSQSFLQSPW